MTSFKLPRQQRRPWFKRPRPAALRKRADSLPLDRPLEAWEALTHEIRALNFTACSGRQRLRCMEPFHRIARFLQAALEKQLAAERLPPSRASEAHALTAREGWTRLAVGYLCAQRDLAENDHDARSEAALCGLQAMAQLMLVCYHQYMPEPRGAWRAIHELHIGAGTGRNKGAAGPTVYGDAPDPDSAYKQILVMAAAGPMRLRLDEQAPVHRVLAGWVRHVSIRPLHDAEPKAPPVVFRPGEDEAPRQYPLDQVPDSQGLKLIDPAPLAGRARRRLELLEAGETRPRLSGERLTGETLRVLLGAWTGAVSRQFPRSETGQDSVFAVGIHQAWQALQAPPRDPVLRCRLTDRSSAGFQALLETAPAGMIEVGELVAVRDGSRWNVGIVRWLRRPEPELMQVGVETIARRPVPVRFSVNSDGHAWSPALLLQSNRAAHHPASLVTGTIPLREHMQINLEGSGKAITLGRMVEFTGSVSRFRIELDDNHA